MASRTSQIIIRIKGGVRAAMEARAVAAGFEAADEAIEDVRTSALAAAIGLDVLSRAQRKVSRANAMLAATSVPAVSGLGLMAAVALPLGSIILPALAIALWQVTAAALAWGTALIGATFGVIAAVGLMAAATIGRFRRMKDVVGSAAYDLGNQLWLLKETFLDVASAGADRLMRGLADGAGSLLPLVRSLRGEFTAIGQALGDMFRTLGGRLAGLQPQISAMLALVPDAIAALGQFGGDALALLVQLATVGMPVLVSALRTVAGWMRDLTEWFTPERVDEATATLRAFFDGARQWWGDFTDPIKAVLGPAVDEAGAAFGDWARPLGTIVAALMQVGRILLPPISVLLGAIAGGLEGVDFSGLDVEAIGGALADAVVAVIAFGRGLIDALEPAMPFLENVILPLVGGIVAGFGGPVLDVLGLVATVLGWVGEKLEPLRGAFGAAGQVIALVFGGALLKVAGSIARVIPLVGKLAGPVLRGLGRAWDFVSGAIGKFVAGALGRFRGWADDTRRVVAGIVARFAWLIGWFGTLPGKLAAAAAGMWDFVKDGFKSAINWVLRKWNGLEFRIPEIDPPGPGPKFGGFTVGMPDIPLLAAGGLITSGGWSIVGEEGPELARFPTGTTIYPASTRGLISSDYSHLRPRDAETHDRGPLVPRVLEAAITVVSQTDGRETHRSVERVRANLDARA